MDKIKILLIDNDRVVSNFIVALLKSDNYKVIAAASGEEAITLTRSHNPALILLDPDLPDLDGTDVLLRIQEWSDVPVIFLSSRRSENETVKALDAGADDYIAKPFGSGELLARVRASLRRHAKLRYPAPAQRDVYSRKGLVIDYSRRLAMLNGNIVKLTPIEYKIVSLLSKHAGKVLTHEFILREVWGPFSGDSQVLRVNIANIRRKIEDEPSVPKYILTETRVGYRMAECDAAPRKYRPGEMK